MKISMARQMCLLFMVLLSGFLITGCGSGGKTGHWLPGNNTTAPTVISTVPANDNTGVCTNPRIAATFSNAMDNSTINNTTFTVTDNVGAPVSGTVTYSDNTAVFTPTDNLAVDNTYTATITTGARDRAGVALASNFVWRFTTGATTCAVPVAPGLLSSFAIASYGGITNAGATKINGNVVMDPNQFCNNEAVGAGDNFGICGDDPPINNPGDTVITQTHPDTTTADAVMVALLAKWNSITMAGSPGGTDLGCGTIGSGGSAGLGIGCAGNFTLPPGIYISSTHSTINVTGDLILDGLGDSNAVFIFQAPSAALTATPGSPGAHPRILLRNGAKASNVWWQVGSSATIGDYSEFQGSVLASASISMGTGATSCGRLLSGAEGSGAFTFLGNTVSVPGHPDAPAGCE